MSPPSRGRVESRPSCPICDALWQASRRRKKKQSVKGQKGACWTRPAQHLSVHLTAREGALVFSTRRGAPRSGWKAPCPGGPRIRVWS